MSQWEKLLNRIVGLSGNLRFDELRKILEAYGYTMNQPRWQFRRVLKIIFLFHIEWKSLRMLLKVDMQCLSPIFPVAFL